MKLSDSTLSIPSRVKAIAGMAAGGSVCDIGCDHGYLLIHLALTGMLTKGAACDINKIPLERAEHNIKAAGCSALIETRLSDGLEAVGAGEFDKCVIAGMGGLLMRGILSRDMGKTLSFKRLILSPHRDADAVRRFLNESGILIADERVIKDGRRYYAVLDCAGRGSEHYTEAEYIFGKRLTERRDPSFAEFLLDSAARLAPIAATAGEGASITRRAAMINDLIDEAFTI